MIGKKLSHYEILELLGTGGMGEVYRARDTKLDRDVAIKVLPEDFANDQERLARFKREAKAIAALDHPNIVTIHSVEESSGLHFIAMQLVRGKTLAGLIPKKGFALEKFFDLAIPLADAISCAHDHGIIHRDLKPANVMVTSDGRVEILDFGLAKLRRKVEAEQTTRMPQSSITDEGHIVGTVAYMSPEQAEGKNLDHRSDIFSLGIVLYEMVTGERPFEGETRVALMSSIMKDTPAPITERKPSLPRHLGRIVRRCLVKDVARRYQTAADVRNELLELRKEFDSGETALRQAGRPTAGRLAGLLRWAGAAAGVFVLVLLAIWVAGPSERGGEEDRGREAATASSIAATDEATTIAVLPFDNVNGDPAFEPFVNGLHEDLITRLSYVDGLKVISKASAHRFDASSLPMPEIVEQLGASVFLEAGVQRAASAVRVTARLVDAPTGLNLWGEAYQEEIAIENVFEVQARLVERIAGRLAREMTQVQRAAIREPPTEVPEAFEAFARARQLWLQLTGPALDGCLEYLDEATSLDPQFARAHAAAADTYLAMEFIGALPLQEAVGLARQSLNDALAIDDELPEAIGALGHVLLHEMKGAQAELELRRAVALNPSYLEGQMFLGMSLLDFGRLAEAKVHARAALDLDPLSDYGLLTEGLVRLAEDDYFGAAQHFQKALDLQPDPDKRLWWARYELAWALAGLGDYERAFAEIELASEATGALAREFDLAPTAVAFQALAGDEDGARARLQELLEELNGTREAAFAIGLAHAVLGDVEEAFDLWLNEAEWTILLPTHFRYGPVLDRFREHARYQEVIESIDRAWGW